MAVKLRLQRIGRKNRPYFRLGAFNSRTRNGGVCLEVLGYYDPLKDAKPALEKERIMHWLSVGAIPSETVEQFLAKEGIMKELMAAKAPSIAKQEKRQAERLKKLPRRNPKAKFKKAEGEQERATKKARRRQQRQNAKAKKLAAALVKAQGEASAANAEEKK